MEYWRKYQTITVGPGTYWVEATNSLNCSIISDTIYIVGSPSQSIDLGPDVGICLGNQAYITPTVNGGTAPFNYLWSNASTLNSIEVGPGTYDLVVTDAMGCMAYDTIEVTSLTTTGFVIWWRSSLCRWHSGKRCF